MHDDDLKTRFRELRAHIEATAPRFDAISKVPSSSMTTLAPRRMLLRQAAIVTLVAMGAGSLYWTRGYIGGNQADLRYTEAAIVKWTSPTDFLLQTPGRELTATVPALFESVVQPRVFGRTHTERTEVVR